MRILILEERLDNGAELQLALEECGAHVSVCHDDESAIDCAREWHPYVTFVEEKFATEAHLSKFARLNFPPFVIVLFDNYDENKAFDVLRHGASNYLMRPVNRRLLKLMLDKYSTAASTIERQSMVLDHVESVHTTMRIPNDSNLIAPIAEHIVSTTSKLYPKTEVTGIRLGLEELLRNAYEHGNLEIGYDDKAEALTEHRFHELLSERALAPPYCERIITIEFKIEQDELFIRIEDQGRGFDYQNVRDPVSEEGKFALNGRGIFLTRAYFDSIEYCGRGNEVKMQKQLGKRTPGLRKLATTEL